MKTDDLLTGSPQREAYNRHLYEDHVQGPKVPGVPVRA
ncbi:hypothetical protein ABH940_001341 [Streptacidiphilus sp. BW17]